MDRKTQQTLFTVVLLLLAFAYLLIQERQRAPQEAPEPAEGYAHLVMGNPSGATNDEANRDNFLMRKPYFALAYNNANGTPNWVSWCLTANDLGSAKRAPQFSPDKDLPRSFRHITPSDYSES